MSGPARRSRPSSVCARARPAVSKTSGFSEICSKSGSETTAPILLAQVWQTPSRAWCAGHALLRLMHGNRDFLIGADFIARSGAEFVSDPAVVEDIEPATVVAHGDALLRDDVQYQQLRTHLRTATPSAARCSRGRSPSDGRSAQALRVRSPKPMQTSRTQSWT